MTFTTLPLTPLPPPCTALTLGSRSSTTKTAVLGLGFSYPAFYAIGSDFVNLEELGGDFFNFVVSHCLFLLSYFYCPILNSRFSPSLSLSLEFLSLEAVLISVFVLCSGRGVGIVRVFVVGFFSFMSRGKKKRVFFEFYNAIL